MDITRDQHFVPQLYLRRFQSDERPGFIYAYDKIKGAVFSPNIANIAHEKFFHDFAPRFIEPDDDPQQVEHFLRDHVEPAFASALRFIDATVEKYGVSDDHKVLLGFYTLYQCFRTSAFRNSFVNLFQDGSEEIKNYAEQNDFPGEIPDLSRIDEFTEDEASLWHAYILCDPPAVMEYSKPLQKHIMVIGVNDTDVPFWTSDNPVVSICHDPTSPIWGGLAAAGTEILYPLSKRLMLHMYERSYFSDKANVDGLCISHDVETVNYCNAQQVSQCSRQVYSPTKDFDLIEEIRAKYPQCFEMGKAQKTWKALTTQP